MKKMQQIFLVLLCLAVSTQTLAACKTAGDSEISGHDITIYDREGNAITVPEEINSIITIGPSNTEIVAALGFADKIVQADMYSFDVPGINPDICTYDLLAPDLEHIVSLNPDIVFVQGFTRTHDEDDPFSQVTAAGIFVIDIPIATGIEHIKEDIRFFAKVLGTESNGKTIITEMEAEINRVQDIAGTISEKKQVYFEISPSPWMWSFGKGTFIQEMLEIAGVINIFAEAGDWISVADEVILELNPDVILTSVDYMDDPTEEIKSRPGWEAITAVKNGDVYYIDANTSNRQTHNITKALWEIAGAVYPEEFR